MADVKKPRTFRKFSYRGVDLEGLVELDFEKVAGRVFEITIPD